MGVFLNLNLSTNTYYIPKYFFLLNIFNLDLYKIHLSIDLFGLVILFLAYIVGFISIIILDNKLYFTKLKYYSIFNLFLIIIYFFISVSNYLLFFFFYECLLLPSFLFVYFISPSRRAIQASIYFVVWTQIGSLLVLIVVSYNLMVTGVSSFFALKLHLFSNLESNIIYLLLFLGFGFKVPIWPFHYWLTKTHVEASSGFSIYLSGFLVKCALFGFYKFIGTFAYEVFIYPYIIICITGIVDSSLKMWGQTDLKKLVAYGTIQEMNLIYLIFIWGDTRLLTVGFLFTIVHSFLSSLMFFLVDCIYRRYNSRSIVELNGILQHTPNLGLTIIFMVIFFSGLPGTLKFIVEFFFFNGLVELSFSITVVILFSANVLGLIGFCKVWFNVLFGINLKVQKQPVLDLSKKELTTVLTIFLFLIFFSFFPSLVF